MTWNLRAEGQRTFGFAGPAPTRERLRKGFREMGLGGRIRASQRRWLNRLATPDAYN